MSRRRLGYLAVPLLAAAACTPTLDPSWLITGPRELALEVEVTDQGPYGQRITESTRTYRDALPLDTLGLRPVVVDVDGPLPPEDLDGTWILCSGIGNCLLRDTSRDRPACDGEKIQPDDPCVFDQGGQATLTIADLPDALPTETSTVFSLLSGPTVAFVASAPEGPGLDGCLDRLDARDHLDGCLLMERALGLGPLGDLVAALEAVGIDPGIDEGAESLLLRPRNRNPGVERIRVDFGDDSIEVSAGEMVRVPRDEPIQLTVLTTDEDLDAYEALVGEQTVMFTDDLEAQWWFDRELTREPPLPGSLFTEVSAGGVTGIVRAHVVVRDNLGGEGWGSLLLDFSG